MKKKLSKLLWNMVKQIIVVATTTAHKVLEETDCKNTAYSQFYWNKSMAPLPLEQAFHLPGVTH